MEGRGLEFRQYSTSASVGWNRDRVLPEGWMPTGVCLYLLLELNLQVGWSKDRFLSEGWMLTRFFYFCYGSWVTRWVGIRTGFCQKAGRREEKRRGTQQMEENEL